MNVIKMCVCLIFFSLLAPVPAWPSPIVAVVTDYYAVRGTTENAIRKDLDDKSPVREGGVSYDAKTSWFVKWNYWWNESEGRCTITKVETRADVHYLLPKLVNTGGLSKPLKLKWDNYMRALLRHEEGHKGFGVDAAYEIEETIRDMDSQASCRQLETKANDIGKAILQKYMKIEKSYDTNNNHGKTEGAVFP